MTNVGLPEVVVALAVWAVFVVPPLWALASALVQALVAGVDAVAEERDERVAAGRAPAVDGGGDERCHARDTRVAPDGGAEAGGIGQRGLAVERQRALGRDADLVAAHQQQVGERRLEPAAQHHHVEQHRGCHRDPRDGECGAERMPAQVAHAPAELHQPLPQSTIGFVRTRRHAASAPAARPSTRESRTLKRTMSGVRSEKTSFVSKKRW